MWTANADGSGVTGTQYLNPDCTGRMQQSSAVRPGTCYAGQSAFQFDYDAQPSTPPYFAPTGGNSPSNVGTGSTGSAATFSAECSRTLLTISVAFVVSCTFLASF
jgi:hypothetical protein